MSKLLALAARYDVELDFGSIPDLIKEHRVRFPKRSLKQKVNLLPNRLTL